MSSVLGGPAQGQVSRFDKKAYLRYMNNRGRAYRYRAMQIISLCRTFSEASKQDFDQDTELKRVLQVCDDALFWAAASRKAAIAEADHHLDLAIRELRDYESKFHPRKNMVDTGMESAKQDDTRTRFWKRTKDEPSIVVDFLLLRNPADPQPIIVKQVLSNGSKLEEVLWNFSRQNQNRLSLTQNPHFYQNLPPSPYSYGDEFIADPIELFQDMLNVHVLTNGPGRVYLTCDQNPQVFYNVWVPKKALIFKDVYGKLIGERIVGESIRGTTFWYHIGRPFFPSTAGVETQDWKAPIRELLHSPDINIRITSIPIGSTASHKPL
ncbi:hypothetical protein BC827DRAFT_772497 [Russula dissimulans]|nr:hypothetical protein BC827DRAFT_772497 [Russula dissimulans]